MTLLLVPSVFGSPCDRIRDSTDCFELWNSQLTDEEKQEAIATMIPDAQEWNANLPLASTPPPNTPITSNEYVQDAWIRILVITPSTYENETLLSTGNGTLVFRSNYQIKQPSGTERGDCKTTHSLTHNAQTSTTFNGINLGSANLVSFSTTQDSLQFVSTLTIQTEHTLKHYQWKRIGHQRICAFSNTERRTKTLTTTDTLTAIKHQNTPHYDLTIQAEYWNTTQFSFSAQNYSKIHLQITPETYYARQTTVLQPFLAHPPYYALQYKVIPVNQKSTRNLKTANGTFWAHQFNNCTITLTDYFTNRTQPCAINTQLQHAENSTQPPLQFSWFTEWQTVSRTILFFLSGWLFWKFMHYLVEEFDALLNS